MKARTTGTYLIIAAAAAMTAVVCFWRPAAVEAAYPAEKAKRAFADRVWTRITGVFRASAASAENVRLRREVASLALLRSDVERLEVENARLRRALEYTAKAPEVWLAAAVLSEGGGAVSARKTIRTDKGSLAGVKDGAVVMVPEGVVGRVLSVTPHTSEVLLVTDPSLKVACAVETPSGEVRGILSGGTDDLLVLKYISSAAEVPPRSAVLTSGLGGVFPRGLPVGTLLGIREGSGVSARVGEVLPSVDFATLRDVFIRREK